MKIRFSILLLFIGAIFGLMACEKEQKQYVIGVSQCSEDIWRDKLNDELIMGTYQHDNVKLRFASANDDDRLQARQIRRFLREGIDLLIVSPNQLHTVSSAIDEAYDRGIPVILFDRKTDSRKYTAFIGADNFEAGWEMGNFITNKLKGRGNIVEISGLEGSSPAIERHRGFMKAISRHPEIKLIARRHAGWLKQKGETEMDNILDSVTEKIDFVFAQNDRMGLGARQASLKHGFKETRFVGIDALPTPGGGLENVRDGRLAASYIYPTRGDLVMQLAMNILENKPFKRDNYLKGALVTRENADVLLMQGEEMAKQRARLSSLHSKVDSYLAQYNHQKMYLLLFSIIILLLIGIIVYTYRNALAKRRLEREAVNAKLQFFTNISHELRTPLTLIAEPVKHIMTDPNLTRKQQNMLQIVNRNVAILIRLVNEILDFRKIQNGKMELTLTSFNLGEHMHRWLELFAASAEKKHIKLQLYVHDQLPMLADLHKVEQISYNLLSNAIKHTPRGGEITLSATKQDQNVRITVADNGPGIPYDEQPHIFKRFYQTRTSNKGGTGIGLAIVKSFAEIQGGSVTLESTPGKGAAFTVTLPLTVQDIKAKTSSTEHTMAQPYEMPANVITGKITNTANNEKPHLLVVDDNADICAYIAEILDPNYNITLAADGREALNKALRDVPDIILCDVMMPVMDGMEFCRRIKQDIITSHIPVVLLTARSLDEQRTEGYNCGADAYITKPFTAELLKSRLQSLIDNRRLMKIAFSADSPVPSIPKSAETIFVDKFRQIIQTKLSDPELNVDRISNEMALSKAQLYRKIKALTGTSPADILREARLKRADRYLQTTDKNIAEIAYEVGFSSPSYFTKCYREYFGHTPNKRQSI